MARVAPSERFRAELDEALAGVGQEQDQVEMIGRLGARLILQQALEDEVTEFLGRARYERAEQTVSHRNGYEPRTVKTTSGVESVLEETFDEPLASRSTVSRILEDTRQRYRRWCERRLDEHDVVYLFCDAIYLKLHPDDEPAEGVLVCWGVTLEGRKVLLGLALGSRESYASWLSFGRDLTARGMNPPAL